MNDYFPIFVQYQALRNQLMDLLSDSDLAHKLPGSPALGELCKEIGETEYAYVSSFKKFAVDFSYKSDDKKLTSSVAALKQWYAAMDQELKSLIEAFNDADLDKQVDRGGWSVPVHIQLDIYKEALLIFYGKAWVYLHALGRPLPDQWKGWIG
jgi:uncharacterized damage-inducible protein DinB